MARTGHTVDHPVLGHRVRFVQTPEETQGELLQIEYIVRRPETPFQHIPLHVHQTSEERFEVVRGHLGVIRGDTTNRQVLHVGQDIRIPAGTPHSFWNAGNDELCFLTDIRPPHNFQTYWETMFGLASDGHVNRHGLPNLLQLGVLMATVDAYQAGVPIGLQRVMFKALAVVGRAVGYREKYAASTLR